MVPLAYELWASAAPTVLPEHSFRECGACGPAAGQGAGRAAPCPCYSLEAGGSAATYEKACRAARASVP